MKAKTTVQPVASTPCLNIRKDEPIEYISVDSYDCDGDMLNDGDKLCSVYDRLEPKELLQCNAFVIDSGENGSDVTIVLSGKSIF